MRFPTDPVSITGVGSHEIGSGFNSRRQKPAGFNSIGIRSHEIGSGFNSRRRKPAGFNSIGIRSHVSKAIYYFIPSLVAIVRGITSLMRIDLFP